MLTTDLPSPADFLPHVARLLQAHPDGLSEYELIKLLQRENILPLNAIRDTLGLFQVHFLLHHVLYQLRENWWQTQQGHLVINPLRFQLQSYQAGSQELANVDHLAVYYRDLQHLYRTTAAEVDMLLKGFWMRFQAREARAEALSVLGLRDPVNHETIKQHYRHLVMQHHPDRGGDTVQLQIINAAMDTLNAAQ